MQDLDLKIIGGEVFDGLGGAARHEDVGIRGDRIAVVGDLSETPAEKTLDAAGFYVAPGFIDIHTHGDVSMLLCPTADSKLRDGVTTELSGNCGMSPFPTNEDTRKERNRDADEWGFEIDWDDFDGFVRRIEDVGSAINRGFLVGHGTVRSVAIGPEGVQATPRQFERMKTLVSQAVEAGAFGMSSGLIYPPGCFATLKELAELAAVAARHGGIYATHIRSEGRTLLEAIDEAGEIGRQSGAPVQISHLKVAGPENWHKIDALCEKLENLRTEIDLAADRYPYVASSTDLDAMLPEWVHDSGRDIELARLKDTAIRKRIEAEMARIYTGDTWSRTMIAGIQSEKRAHVQGMTIAELAEQQGKDPTACLIDLLIAENARVAMLSFSMNEENLERILKLPFVAIGSDASARSTDGPTAKTMCHPRAFGTFSRVLGRYVRESRLLDMPEAIRKMTSLPADRLGLARRGRISSGCFADITIFDPQTVTDRAVYEEPMQFSCGVKAVIVNGALAVEGGRVTGALNGKVLRRE